MSTKYRLIKKYPGSPKLGTMGEIIDKTVMYTETDNDIPYYSTEYIDFERYPEYWKNIVEKNYQILSFKQNSLVKDLWTEFAHGWCRNSNGNPVTDPYSYDDILNNHLNGGVKYRIHSVKRLSDGEVFTVGDKMIDTFSNCIITISKITLKDGRCFLNDFNINCVGKVKQPLFTTEDGVDIYEGDKMYYLHNSLVERPIIETASDKYNYKVVTECKYFSTKEAAEEYVLMIKPCLSVKDILERFSSVWLDVDETALKELVKSKI